MAGRKCMIRSFPVSLSPRWAVLKCDLFGGWGGVSLQVFVNS